MQLNSGVHVPDNAGMLLPICTAVSILELPCSSVGYPFLLLLALAKTFLQVPEGAYVSLSIPLASRLAESTHPPWLRAHFLFFGASQLF